ncbi:MAG: AraC family transcriptional regulator [Paenibacillaceae bacterium]|nr:AraC family transcriptional regulator [Paenibacillaceae bacterium]
MENNLLNIARIVDYIEVHLEEKLDLESIANEAGYSKYHLHRMFTSIVGFTVHSYVQRRRMTEAARVLIFSDKSIMEISLYAGYETQQSFSVAFKAMFGISPQELRKKKDFYPLQLKFTVDGKKQLRGDMIMDIKIIESEKILLVGYTGNTRNGFSVIGESMMKLQTNKEKIANRSETDCLIALNDYTKDFDSENEQPAFDFYGVSEVTDFSTVPAGMITKELPASKYVVFSFTGKPQDSMQPVADYIYKEWFPQSTCQFSENNMYDFTKCYEAIDSDGNSKIEYWVPIL